MVLGIWFWIILFVIVGGLMLSKGLKSGTHSFLADVGRIILWLAWICFLAWLVKSCIDLATRNHA